METKEMEMTPAVEYEEVTDVVTVEDDEPETEGSFDFVGHAITLGAGVGLTLLVTKLIAPKVKEFLAKRKEKPGKVVDGKFKDVTDDEPTDEKATEAEETETTDEAKE